MCQAHQEEEWNHTSALLAMLFNVNRGKDVEPKTPDNYHPMRADTSKGDSGRIEVPQEIGFELLKKTFVDSPTV